jgi:hypothetical protein
MSACSSDPHQCAAAEAHAVDSFHFKHFKLPKQSPINVFSQEVLGPGHQCQKPLESNTTIVNKPAVRNDNHDSTSAQVLFFSLHAFLELKPHPANL